MDAPALSLDLYRAILDKLDSIDNFTPEHVASFEQYSSLIEALADIKRSVQNVQKQLFPDGSEPWLYDDIGNEAFYVEDDSESSTLSAEFTTASLMEVLAADFRDSLSPPPTSQELPFLEENSQFDIDTAADSAHQLLLTPFRFLRLSHKGHLPSNRAPRLVELAVKYKLKEVVYCPDLGYRAHRFLRKRGDGENLEKLRLSAEQLWRSKAGLALANSCRRVSCEGDTEFAYRCSHADLSALVLSWITKLEPNNFIFPCKGTVEVKQGSSGGTSSNTHAYADLQICNVPIEVKQLASIKGDYCSKLFGITAIDLQDVEGYIEEQKALGFVYNFQYPKNSRDQIDAYSQPLIQLWAQMEEKKSLLGVGTSHDFSFFVCKDPQYPERLYLSPCYPSSASKPDSSNSDISMWADPEEDEDYMSNGLYTKYAFLRIATNEDEGYHEEFMTSLRGMKLLKKDHKHAQVLSGVGTGIDLARGYQALPPEKQNRVKQDLRPQRAPKNYKDLSTSDVEVERHEAPEAPKVGPARSLRPRSATNRTGAAKAKASGAARKARG